MSFKEMNKVTFSLILLKACKVALVTTSMCILVIVIASDRSVWLNKEFVLVVLLVWMLIFIVDTAKTFLLDYEKFRRIDE